MFCKLQRTCLPNAPGFLICMIRTVGGGHMPVGVSLDWGRDVPSRLENFAFLNLEPRKWCKVFLDNMFYPPQCKPFYWKMFGGGTCPSSPPPSIELNYVGYTLSFGSQIEALRHMTTYRHKHDVPASM